MSNDEHEQVRSNARLPDPICAHCNHKRSHHGIEQPYECYDMGVGDDSYKECECLAFSYIKQ